MHEPVAVLCWLLFIIYYPVILTHHMRLITAGLKHEYGEREHNSTASLYTTFYLSWHLYIRIALSTWSVFLHGHCLIWCVVHTKSKHTVWTDCIRSNKYCGNAVWWWGITEVKENKCNWQWMYMRIGVADKLKRRQAPIAVLFYDIICHFQLFAHFQLMVSILYWLLVHFCSNTMCCANWTTPT